MAVSVLRHQRMADRTVFMHCSFLEWMPAFIGFEATAIYREEARTPTAPSRAPPTSPSRSSACSYAFISWVIIQAFDNTGAASDTVRPWSVVRHVGTGGVGLARRLNRRLA